MTIRPFWIEKINQAWTERSIAWLSGVRRVGKTTLSKMFKHALYLNCDLPSVARTLTDPEMFYDNINKEDIIIFDEIHRLEEPSRLLKIAADEYPHLKILATGSSTLAATNKFRDSLTGRKKTIYLPPVLWEECQNIFHIKDINHRLLYGGLPEPLLSITSNETFYSEWIDSFYARDIQELFSIRNRTGFLKLLHLLLRQSGQLIDYTNLAKLSELSRPTVKAHVEAMNIAHAIYLLPPYHGGGRREIISRPKAYGFDTGFISFINGWDSIRDTDREILWEHLVLDTLRTYFPGQKLYYWRDKSGREINFIIQDKSDVIHTIECKINPDQYESKSLIEFRSLYPNGQNLIVCPFIKAPYKKKYKNLIVNTCSLQNFLSILNQN